MAKIKVYGGLVMDGGVQKRAVVATTSFKKAAEIAQISLSEIRTYWSVTDDAKEVELAMASPETLVLTGSFY